MAYSPTPEQQRIYDFVRLEAKHGIIDAVAGSGKTTTIINSVEQISTDKKALFCAFNKSIRDEIRTRIEALGVRNVDTHNLHQMGYQCIRHELGNNPVVRNMKFRTLINTYFDKEFGGKISEYLKLDGTIVDPMDKAGKFALLRAIRKLKNTLYDSANLTRLTLTKLQYEDFSEMLDRYRVLRKKDDESSKRKREILLDITETLLLLGIEQFEKGAEIDFADMLYLPVKLKFDPPFIYDMVFVDECQDLSKAQFALVMKFVKKSGRVIAVGDPHQSIYGFTGADIDSFNRFRAHLPNA